MGAVGLEVKLELKVQMQYFLSNKQVKIEYLAGLLNYDNLCCLLHKDYFHDMLSCVFVVLPLDMIFVQIINRMQWQICLGDKKIYRTYEFYDFSRSLKLHFHLLPRLQIY